MHAVTILCCRSTLQLAEVDVEASYLLASPSDRGSGAASRMSRGHSRAPSTASAASWDSSVLGPPQQHSSSQRLVQRNAHTSESGSSFSRTSLQVGNELQVVSFHSILRRLLFGELSDQV